MTGGKNASPAVPHAPTYNELFTLVETLRQEVAAMGASSREASNADQAERQSRQPVMDFRVLPDLDKTVGTFDGHESTHASADWLASIEGIADLNCWPSAYRVQFVRANVQGAARDWFVGRLFVDWADFKRQFSATFVRTVRMSDRWDALRERCQLKDEYCMDYFQAKVRLCRDLLLSFNEIRDHVIQGLYSKEVAMYAMSRTHRYENELLTDLLDWERMHALRNAAGLAQVKSKEPAKIVEPRQ
ncbi:unnamed protein product [Macrosiphum euphorbiae]|uniref:Retrotransposon gag domain-containing protein n=1 Tax=Macrosiphum euphorbiae TaxID=13131 RepID=A0AAV0WAI9_9HEMI|nr:unnamed protein product [Macrosiphum euphorbiae]